MIRWIIDYGPYALSLTTILQFHMAGEKHRHTWSVCLASQTLWVGWIVTSEQWGFLPASLFITWQCISNHFKWRTP